MLVGNIQTKATLRKKINVGQYAIYFVLLGLIIVSTLLSEVFLTKGNIINILRQISINGILACGMTYAIIGGGFDLSIGSIMSVCAVVALKMQVAGVPAEVTILIAIGLGLLFGSVTGGVLAGIKGKIGDAFIVTLGMQIFLQAIAMLITRGRSVKGSNSDFYNFTGQGSIGIIPVSVIILAIIVIISQFVLTKTKYGKSVKCIGENIVAANLSGIRVGIIKMSTYIITGFCAAIAAIVLTARTWGASPVMGVGYELDAIMAVIVGGTPLTGGKGSIIGTVVGALIIGVLSNILNLMGVSSYNQMIIKGLIIIIAVLISKKK